MQGGVQGLTPLGCLFNKFIETQVQVSTCMESAGRNAHKNKWNGSTIGKIALRR